jgi:hypothetical protein
LCSDLSVYGILPIDVTTSLDIKTSVELVKVLNRPFVTENKDVLILRQTRVNNDFQLKQTIENFIDNFFSTVCEHILKNDLLLLYYNLYKKFHTKLYDIAKTAANHNRRSEQIPENLITKLRKIIYDIINLWASNYYKTITPFIFWAMQGILCYISVRYFINENKNLLVIMSVFYLLFHVTTNSEAFQNIPLIPSENIQLHFQYNDIYNITYNNLPQIATERSVVSSSLDSTSVPELMPQAQIKYYYRVHRLGLATNLYINHKKEKQILPTKGRLRR